MIFRKWPFSQCFRSKKTKLPTEFIFLIVTITLIQIEHTGKGISKLSRKSAGEKIRVAQEFIVENRDRASCCPRNVEVIRIENGNAFHFPQHTTGRISS